MYDPHCTWLCVLITLLPFGLCKFDAFSDNTLFGIDWPGETSQDLKQDSLEIENSVTVTTQNNEKYVCVIPSAIVSPGHLSNEAYHGPDEMTLMKPLFDQATCSYRIESYWTYELCHGRLLRQYHEEKEMNKKPKLQEYILGRGKQQTAPEAAAKTKTEDSQETEESAKESTKSKKVPLLKIDGAEIPYYKVQFEDGTLCDLNGVPRRASLHYVCQPEGKGEIYELKEVSTCEYEVVVLTSLLCAHPNYQVKQDTVNKIHCHSLPGSPARPKSLESLERETNLGRYNRKELWKHMFDEADEEIKIETQRHPRGKWVIKQRQDDDDEDDDGVTIKEEVAAPVSKEAIKIEAVTSKGSQLSAVTDKQLLYDFLTGQHCIQGGTGWWRHEFCYGKTVIQFHDDPTGRTNIMLGMWHIEDHQSWLRQHPTKRPKPKGFRRHISHFYSMGDICDQTGKRRNTEVKLKCKENTSQPHSVAIYLVEPNICEYILVVESNILCSVLDLADDEGMIPASAFPKP